jgi:vanillate O-demethylase ferredoxin subunit
MPLIRVRVEEAVEEAEGVRSLLLARRGPFRLPAYAPGAHVDVHCGEGIIRQYSLCGDPRDRRRYRIAVTRVARSRGGSRLMHSAVREGDVLEIGAPRNDFPLDEGAPHSVLLAAGIGITPIVAMAERLARLGRSFEMHYFSRGPSHTAFRDRILGSDYAARVALHEGLDPAATQARLREALTGRAPEGLVYMCGPGPFMDAARAIAGETWPAEAIRLERFAAGPAAAGGPTAPFAITLARSGERYEVGADETILEVLERHDVNAAFSCEQGVCGTCVTAVIGGRVDHRDAFLTQRQRAAHDRMCLCVSRAEGDELVLDL